MAIFQFLDPIHNWPLSWLAHVERIESERTPKYLLNGELFGVRRRGRPRKRWPQDVKDDLRRMRIGKWEHRNEMKNFLTDFNEICYWISLLQFQI
jgi:hypothetical protein